jgi:hypothetical protein
VLQERTELNRLLEVLAAQKHFAVDPDVNDLIGTLPRAPGKTARINLYLCPDFD